MSRLIRAVSVIAVVGGLTTSFTGCKVGPNYKRPVVSTPATYRGALAPGIGTDTGSTPPLGAQKWDTVFTDPILKSLIAEALKNNYDVKIAADRVLELQQQVSITRASQYPSLSLGATETALGLPTSLVDKANEGPTGTGSSSNGAIADKYYAGGYTASASWNLDFWGMYRRQTEAARAQLRATEWAKQATYSNLVQGVASSYYQLRALDALLRTAKDTAAARAHSVELIKRLADAGSVSNADLRQAEELLYTAQAQIPDQERQIEQQENNLSLLLGHSPGPIERGISVADAPHPTSIPVGMPSELLERRPDIRRAEELLVQANANIGVAKAQFFPQIALSGIGGIASNQLKGLVDSGNGFFYLVGAASEPIFDAGKIRSNYRLAESQHQELLDTYQQTIAGALRDTSNALVAYNKTRQSREKQQQLTTAAADASRLARLRYDSGAASFLEVLTNDTNLYSAQQALSTAQLQEALSLVQLYSALGGGW